MPAYLDHAATTPMSPSALAAMTAELAEVGNPSSLHAAGRRARKVVEQAREQIAQALGAQPVDVIFTSGGTEADNLAVLGLYRARRASDPTRTHVIASAIEHHAVLDPVQALADREGATVHWLRVNRCGQVDVEHLQSLLSEWAAQIAFVAVMSANNEVGTRQPIADVVAACAPLGIPVHCDAVQSVAWEPFNFRASGLASAAVTAHKVGGPHGIGALLLARGVEIEPITFGGGQEAKLRSGTLDAPAASAFAAALTETVREQQTRSARVRALREQLVAAVRESAPDAVLNGCDDCLPSIAHFSFPGCEGDALLMLLDSAEVQCSTGSACTAGVPVQP
ncbi:MAG: cysteine desulfurase, partial [Actinobacteria bacterium]|nr:cysteine desulfurase [Actinomycetota bacterium]